MLYETILKCTKEQFLKLNINDIKIATLIGEDPAKKFDLLVKIFKLAPEMLTDAQFEAMKNLNEQLETARKQLKAEQQQLINQADADKKAKTQLNICSFPVHSLKGIPFDPIEHRKKATEVFNTLEFDKIFFKMTPEIKSGIKTLADYALDLTKAPSKEQAKAINSLVEIFTNIRLKEFTGFTDKELDEMSSFNAIGFVQMIKRFADCYFGVTSEDRNQIDSELKQIRQKFADGVDTLKRENTERWNQSIEDWLSGKCKAPTQNVANLLRQYHEDHTVTNSDGEVVSPEHDKKWYISRIETDARVRELKQLCFNNPEVKQKMNALEDERSKAELAVFNRVKPKPTGKDVWECFEGPTQLYINYVSNRMQGMVAALKKKNKRISELEAALKKK